MKVQKRIATLTPEENHAGEFAFCFHLDDGKTDLQADKLAWWDLLSEFPRLTKYAGCH